MLSDCDGTPDVIVIATGSEVGIAVEAAAEASSKKVRVVSMPCTSIFDAQDAAYKRSRSCPRRSPRASLSKAAVTDGWWKYVGSNGKVIGIDTFGESARPASCSSCSASPRRTSARRSTRSA